MPDNEKKVIVAYKAFDKDLKCRGFQYEIGKTYIHEGKVEICASGFHACEFPLDIWKYYPLTESRVCRVELSGEVICDSGDSKVAAEKISIGQEIGTKELVDDVIFWISSFVAGAKDTEIESGNSSTQAASGNYSTQAASGDSSTQAASGDSSTQAASGNYSKQELTGKNGVAVAAGTRSRVKATEGGCFALRWDDESRPRIAVAYVGENGIKADTWYCVDERGNFIEVEQGECNVA